MQTISAEIARIEKALEGLTAKVTHISEVLERNKGAQEGDHAAREPIIKMKHIVIGVLLSGAMSLFVAYITEHMK